MEELLLLSFRGTTEEVSEATNKITLLLDNQEFIEAVINFIKTSSDENLVLSSFIQIKHAIQCKWLNGLTEKTKENIFQWFIEYDIKSSQNFGILLEISDLISEAMIFEEERSDVIEMLIRTSPLNITSLVMLRSYFMVTKFKTGIEDDEYIMKYLDLIYKNYQRLDQQELSIIFETLDFIHYRKNDTLFLEQIEGISAILAHGINIIKEHSLLITCFEFVLSIHQIVTDEVVHLICSKALDVFYCEENLGIVEPAYLVLEQFAQTNAGLEFYANNAERFIEIMFTTYKITASEEKNIEEDLNDFVSSNFVLSKYYPSKKIYMNNILDKLCNNQEFFQLIFESSIGVFQGRDISEQDLISAIAVLNAISNDIQNSDMDTYQYLFNVMLELIDSDCPFIRASSLGFIANANEGIEFEIENLSQVLTHIEDEYSFVRFYAINALSTMLSCIGEEYKSIEEDMLEILDPLLDQFFSMAEILTVGQMTDSIKALMNVFNEHLVPRAEQFMLNLIHMFVQTPDALPYTKQSLYDLFTDFVKMVSEKNSESSETLLRVAFYTVEILNERTEDRMMVESLFDFAGSALLNMPVYMAEVKEILPSLAEVDSQTEFENTPRLFQVLRGMIAKMHATGRLDEEFIRFCIEQSLAQIEFDNDNSNSAMHLLGSIFLACKGTFDLSDIVYSIAELENDNAYENNGYIYLVASTFVYNNELALSTFEDRFWEHFDESTIELLPHIMRHCFNSIPIGFLPELIIMEVDGLSNNIFDDDEGIFNILTTLEYLNYSSAVNNIREVLNLYKNEHPDSFNDFISTNSDLLEKIEVL